MYDNVIIYDAVLKRETERAILVEYEDDEVWLPKSRIDYDLGVAIGGRTSVEVPQWLATRNGWCD